MALEHLADLLASWKACLDTPPPGPNESPAINYTIVVNSPIQGGDGNNAVSYINGFFLQYMTSPFTFSGGFGGSLKATALYSDKRDATTGQPFDSKQSEQLDVTLTDAVLGPHGEITLPPTIHAGQQVYQIVDVRNEVIVAVLDEVNNPAVLTLTFLCSPLPSV
jgi:hypothetical protein